MVFECKNCGAKLNVLKTDEMITCEYCGTVNKVQFSMNDYFRNMSVKSKKYSKISVFITIGMIVFGIAMFLIVSRKATDSFSSDDDFYYGTFKYNYYQDGGYLIDNNNDDFLDVVTIALNIEDSENYLQILDGKTGERIQSLKLDKEKKPKLFIVNEFIFIPKDDFTLTVYKKGDLSEIKTYSLSDKLDQYTYFENKLYFETHDDNLWTIDLNTFELRKENFNLKLERRPSRYIHLNSINEENLTYSVKKKEKSSKDVFSVIALENNIELWNLPLGFEDMTWWDGPVLVLADQNIITFGKKFTSDNLGYLIGIDKNEGRIKYEVQKSGKDCRLYDFYYNGRYVIANINGTFHAFDPSTGETKWVVGNICE